MLTPWKESYDQPRQHIKMQRHYFANKALSSQGYGFSIGHVWMWELEYKENWSLKSFLSLLAILWNSAFRWLYLSFSPLLFTSLLFTAICKASSDSHPLLGAYVNEFNIFLYWSLYYLWLVIYLLLLNILEMEVSLKNVSTCINFHVCTCVFIF